MTHFIIESRKIGFVIVTEIQIAIVHDLSMANYMVGLLTQAEREQQKQLGGYSSGREYRVVTLEGSIFFDTNGELHGHSKNAKTES